MKICTKCKQRLDESCFSIKKDSKDGLSTVCRDCKQKYDKEYDKKRKQLLKENKIQQKELCVKCGKEIKYENKIKNVWYVSKFCINCYPNQRFKEVICEKCGKMFKVGMKPSKLNDFIVRKYCPDCSSMNQDQKEVVCEKCGKTFLVGRTPDGRHFRHQRVCDDCSKPQTEKTLICQKCGKEFQVGKYPGTNSFKKKKFCSDFCASSKTEFRDGRVQLKIEKTNCKSCGKEIILKHNEKGTVIERTVCDDCLKPKKKEPFIIKKCSVCNKSFKSYLEPCGNYSDSQYCSDTCALEGFKRKTRKTCQERYGVDYPCLTEKALENNAGNIISETNLRFAKLLEENNIRFKQEHQLQNYSYDFCLLDKNILIEINPTYTHNIIGNHFGKPKDKFYHYFKTKTALNNNYICICVWDWDNWKDIIDLIKQNELKIEETEIKLHYSKGKENIISNNEENTKLLEQGYLPIYDDGFKVISLDMV